MPRTRVLRILLTRAGDDRAAPDSRPRRRGTRFAAATAPLRIRAAARNCDNRSRWSLAVAFIYGEAAPPRGVTPPQAESRPHWGRTPKTIRRNAKKSSRRAPRPKGGEPPAPPADAIIENPRRQNQSKTPRGVKRRSFIPYNTRLQNAQNR